FQRGQAFPRTKQLARHGEPAATQTGQRHADHAGDDATLETVARFLSHGSFLFHPTRPAAFHVSRFEVLFRKWLFGLEQFDHRIGELCAGGPGFIDARAGENIRGAAAFADARVTVADEMWFTASAGFAKGLGAPGPELATLEIPPEIRMQHPVLEISIGGAHRAIEP